MADTLEKLKASNPMCFADFTLQEYPNGVPSRWNTGEFFVTKRVACSCGQLEIRLLVTPIKKMHRLFWKKGVVTNLAPLYIECPTCANRKLLFDPRIHGWDGKSGYSASLVGEGDPCEFGKEPGAVIVNYSYQGVENYESLFEDGTENPQDFFDTFTAYFIAKGKKMPVEVVSYECA